MVDFDYSPDGSCIVFLVSNGEYYISSSSSKKTLLHYRVKDARRFESIKFVGAIGDHPVGVIIGSDCEGVFEVVEFGKEGQKIVLEGNGSAKINYHQATRTIYVSSSLAPALTTFALFFDSVGRVSADDATYFNNFSNSDSSFDLQLVRTGDVVTESPILCFTFDSSITEDTVSALCLHAGGISQIDFPIASIAGAAVVEPVEEVVGDLYLPASVSMEVPEGTEFRRMSFEGQILVTETSETSAVEIELDTAEAESVEFLVPAKVELVEEVVEEELSIKIEEEEVVLPAVLPEAPIVPEVEKKLAGSVMNDAIKSLKAAKMKNTTIKSEEEILVSNAWASGGQSTPKKGKKKEEGTVNGDLLREMKKLEESLPIKIGEIVRAEMMQFGE